MFVKFECGCIGLKTDRTAIELSSVTEIGNLRPASNVIIFVNCLDHGDERFTCQYRDTDKPSAPICLDEERALVFSLNKLIEDGYRLRQIKGLLQ